MSPNSGLASADLKLTHFLADLLMKAEDDEVRWGVNEASRDDIADAAIQYEIVVPVCTENLIRVDDVVESPKLAPSCFRLLPALFCEVAGLV
jgi:hypothetical protein